MGQNIIVNSFPLLLKLSLIASVMAFIVLGVRFCLRKAPKVYTYILWIFVFIRAVLPISYSSAYSLWHMLKRIFSSPDSLEPVSHVTTDSPFPAGIPRYAKSAAASVSAVETKNITTAVHAQTPDLWTLTAAIWILGISVMLVYSIYTMRKLRKTVRFATLVSPKYTPANCPVYESDQIKTAFILGFFRPVIYLPKGLTASGKRLILEHESVHLRRHDHQVKLAAWMILTLHWFNPLMWISFQFLNKDMELSCDEQVLINLGSQVRTDYSSLLLDLAVPGRISSGMPLAFSEGNTKIRIKNILNYRPVKFGSAAAAILLIFITVYGCMGNPKKEPDPVSSVSVTESLDPQTTEAELTPEEKEELAFVENFIQNLIDCRAEEIYAVLSPELKKEADTFMISSIGIELHEPGVHRRMNPFVPTDAPLIEKTSDGYRYQMKRPEYPPPPTYQKFHSADIWEGTLSLEKTDDGLQVTQWEDYNYNEITSCMEYEWEYQYYSFSVAVQVELDWIKEHPKEVSHLFYYSHADADPETLITERFHLRNGKVTDIQKDEEKHLRDVTYSWGDGSVVFHMEQLLDQIWYVTGADILES